MDFRKTLLGGAALACLFAQPTLTPPVIAASTSQNTAATVDKLPPPADVDIGGEVVMRIRSSAGGLTPSERAANVTDRLTRLVAVPDLTPADVVLYTPDHKPPVIYVLGRKLITVDNATAVASGAKPIDLATKWAKQLQQVLPRVDIRLRNEPEPVIPADPPLTVTSDFTQVGGNVGDILLRDKLVMRLRGPQPHGETAAERADEISALLASAIHATQDLAPTDIEAVAVSPQLVKATPRQLNHRRHASLKEQTPSSTAPLPTSDPADLPTAKLMIGTREIIAVTPADSVAAGISTPLLLAQGWAKNIRNVVFPPPKPVAPQSNPVPPPPVAPPTAPVTVAPPVAPPTAPVTVAPPVAPPTPPSVSP